MMSIRYLSNYIHHGRIHGWEVRRSLLHCPIRPWFPVLPYPILVVAILLDAHQQNFPKENRSIYIQNCPATATKSALYHVPLAVLSTVCDRDLTSKKQECDNSNNPGRL